MKPQRVYDICIIVLAAGMIADAFGAFGWIHPRKCPACERPYHRGQPCDWLGHGGQQATP